MLDYLYSPPSVPYVHLNPLHRGQKVDIALRFTMVSTLFFSIWNEMVRPGAAVIQAQQEFSSFSKEAHVA